MENNKSSYKKPWSEQTWYVNCMAILPLLRWGIIAILALAGYYIYQRDVNSAHVVNVNELKKEIEAAKKVVDLDRAERMKDVQLLKDSMLTREVFEAYREADKHKFERIEKNIEKLIDRP